MGRHPANAGVVQEHAVWALYYLTTGCQPTTFRIDIGPHGRCDRLEPTGATGDLHQRIKRAGVLEAVRRAMARPWRHCKHHACWSDLSAHLDCFEYDLRPLQVFTHTYPKCKDRDMVLV